MSASQILGIGSENDLTTYANMLTSQNKDAELFGDLLSALSNSTNSTENSITFGKLLQNTLKSEREQNENSLSTTASPALTESSDDLRLEAKSKEKSPKRKRPRRNPVWAYFEIRGGNAYCMEEGCKYNTGSVYSTNLKVHLKSHHNAKYNEVMRAECQNQMNQLAQSGQPFSHLAPAIMGTTLMISNFDQNPSKEITERHPTLESMLQVKKPVVPQITEKPLASSPLLAAALKKPISPSSDESLNDRIKKRRRLRRHPVWAFFDDLDDKNIGCLQCDFKTSSGFTTNLKMHLKAHHKGDYIKVMQMECDQRKEEGCVDSAPQGKKKKRTAEELEEMLDKYKAKHGNEIEMQAGLSPQAFEKLASLLSLSQNINLDHDALNPLIYDSMSSPEDNPSEVTYASLKAEVQDEPTLPLDYSTIKTDTDEDPAPSLTPIYPLDDEPCSKFRDFVQSLTKLTEKNPAAKDMIKQAKDLSLGRLINEIGVQNISLITSSAFLQMLIAFDPTYNVDINHLKKLAENPEREA